MTTELSNHQFLGGDNDLVVTVVRFFPEVVCSPHSDPSGPTFLKACQAIVDQMETRKDIELFAQDSIYDRNVENRLPFYYTAPAEGSTILPGLSKPRH